MAIRHVESFDTHFSATNMALKYAAQSGTYGAGTVLQSGRSLISRTTTPVSLRTKAVTAFTTGFQGIRFRASGNLTADCKILSFMNGTNEQIALYAIAGTTGFTKFRVKRGATTVGTTTNEFNNTFPIYVEFKWIADTDGTNGTVEIRVAEQVELTVTATDTTNYDTTRNADCVQLDSLHSGSSYSLDDWYFLDTTGSIHTTYLGDSVVEGLLSTADGNRNQWTRNSGTSAHETYIDDVDTHDGDTTYLFVPNTSDGQVELFTWADLAVIVGTVHAVFLYAIARMDASGTDKFRFKFRQTSGTPAEANGPTDHTVSIISGWAHYAEVFDQDPVAVGAWTVANFNSMEFGFESRP